ncbi:methionine biosynthesis PLP-dependent protein [Anaerobacillus sp. CMMVII]|uniref:methionine biosynthesis PLP-dependent protein n=1 Tax=Anaerobacillus sp. CMMVII TaxID=2755588 RepID=UPI0021B83B2B|nr:methionine biosynthesis PLP-dependent protein [Anaerobacillus sp. CMMVII]MCT8138867.1 methionine biosynthesis PLP-dependent protein [Anaerobacillus sp. CMMVII]
MGYKHLETDLVQLGNRSDNKTGAINPPVYFSTAYRHEGIGQSTGYDYSRTGNPTRHILEEGIALLEGGDRGFACSSGMAAIQTVMSIFKQGDEIIVCQDLYGGTYRLFQQGWQHWGISFRYWDGENYQKLDSLVTEATKAIFIETPTNPLMQEMSIAQVSEFAQKYHLLLIVDNTFYTPYLQRPIAEGADIVIHSATKYLGGHNDVLAGLVTAKGEALCERIGFFHYGIGATLSPFDSWLLIRGMKTLALRMEKHEENAKAIAKFLSEHPLITDVLYPGRGGMLSFRIKDAKWVNQLLQSLKLITFAESLGGVESLMTYPTTQTHADIPEELREKNGVCKRLLRFSVGIENKEDLIDDLAQGLASLQEGGSTFE